MTAFLQTPAWVDTFELVASLRDRMPLFGKATYRGIRRLHLRGPAADGGDIVFAKEWEHWPELQTTVSRLYRAGGDAFLPVEEGGRIFMEMQEPGYVPTWSAASDDLTYRRFMVAVRSNPGVALLGPDQALINVIGRVILLDQTQMHSIPNFGTTARIALVLDAKPRQA